MSRAAGGPARAYFSAVYRIAASRFALALALIVAVTLTEGIGLLLLVPLLQSVGLDVTQGAAGRIGAFLDAGFARVGLVPSLAAVLTIYVAVVAGQAALRRWQRLVELRLLQGVTMALRVRLYRAVAHARWPFLTRRRSTDLVHALTTEADRVGSATTSLLSFVAQSLIAALYVALAAYLAPALTLVAVTSGVVLLSVLRGTTARARGHGEELSAVMGDLFTVVEQVEGMKTIKSHCAEERTVGRFERLSEQIAELHLETVRNFENAGAWFRVGSVVILGLVLYVSVEVLALPAATILLLLYVFARLVPRFSGLQQSYNGFVNGLPAATRLLDLIAACEAAAESEGSEAPAPGLEQEIRLEGVSFGYGGGRARALSEVELSIPAGRTTAIVGPSGAGKSTVADLVMGLVHPDEGRVLVDGRPLEADRLRGWRSAIGYVPQDAVLFHDSLRNNLLWARPGAADAELLQALGWAAAETFVARLPGGLDTRVGDRGVQLSGGERQRIALARALLRRPSLLILDEATSALDSENERRFREAVERLHGSLTILVIAHRLSSIQGADLIHVLEEGRVTESGSWSELVVGSGRFATLHRAQRLEPFAKVDGANARAR